MEVPSDLLEPDELDDPDVEELVPLLEEEPVPDVELVKPEEEPDDAEVVEEERPLEASPSLSTPSSATSFPLLPFPMSFFLYSRVLSDWGKSSGSQLHALKQSVIKL